MKFGIVIVAVLALGIGPLRAREPAPPAQLSPATSSPQLSRSVWDGVYTAQQARRGALRSGLCVPCHGADFEGDSAPALTGPAFTAKWNGKTIGDLFELINKDMPNDDPGSLSQQQSADFLAYILLANRFPAGKAELAIDIEMLKQIRFEASKP
jgi:hypothetical protein